MFYVQPKSELLSKVRRELHIGEALHSVRRRPALCYRSNTTDVHFMQNACKPMNFILYTLQDLTEKVMADEEVKAITTGGPLPGAMQDASAHLRRCSVGH